MKEFRSAVKRLYFCSILWALSILCEIPFYLFVGVIGGLFSLRSNPWACWRGMFFGLLVGTVSLVWRFISLHFVGTWVLKRALLTRGASPLGFGLADFLLANLWVGTWALLDPRGPAVEVFRFPALWSIAIPSIGFGSALSRSLYKRWFVNNGICPPVLWKTKFWPGFSLEKGKS